MTGSEGTQLQRPVTGNVDRQEIGFGGPKIPENLVRGTKFPTEAARKYCPRLGKLVRDNLLPLTRSSYAFGVFLATTTVTVLALYQ